MSKELKPEGLSFFEYQVEQYKRYKKEHEIDKRQRRNEMRKIQYYQSVSTPEGREKYNRRQLYNYYKRQITMLDELDRLKSEVDELRAKVNENDKSTI
jgi:transcription initiation factor TFIIIB Brf1 subunit/transcription initiation factor TFIIB